MIPGLKDPWRRERLPTPGFWPGEFYELDSMASKRVRHDWATFTSIFSHTWDSDIAVCVFIASHVWLFVTPWTVAHQVPLSMGFSGQEYWSVLPFPFLGDLLTQEMNGWHHQFNGHEFGQTLRNGEGQEGLVCCSSRGLKESDMTWHLRTSFLSKIKICDKWPSSLSDIG